MPKGWEWIIILVIVVLIWGAPKLPGMAKSLGQSLRIFRKEMKNMNEDKNSEKDSKSDASSEGDKPAEKSCLGAKTTKQK